jgi:hypothetical protein
MSIWIIFIGFMILSWIVSMVLKSKFKNIQKYLLIMVCQVVRWLKECFRTMVLPE